MPTMRHWDRGAHHSQKCFLGSHKPTDLSHFGSPESTAQSLCVLLWLCKQMLDLESGNLDSIQPLTSHVILCNTLPIFGSQFAQEHESYLYGLFQSSVVDIAGKGEEE